MNEPRYVDPNSGAAPQPGGMVVGGAESQRGFAAEALSKAQEESVTAAGEAVTENPPTTTTEAELQRQVGVTQEQQAAQQGTADAQPPAEAKTPDLHPTAEEATANAEQAAKAEAAKQAESKGAESKGAEQAKGKEPKK